MTSTRILWLLLTLAGLFAATGAQAQDRQPNVILIVTDDMGMGDFAPFGNPVVQMPNLERLHAESTVLTDFHVDPTCSPTRAALMTGQHSLRAGVWHTIMARHMLKTEAYTMAELFKANGYSTGIFGKWHLGDSYPMRPQDQGFDRVVIMGGGGVGQTPDYWGNTHFGGSYWVDGKPQTFGANATDVWFDEAGAFVEQESKAGRSFFAYIPTNAAHTPWRGPQEYVQPYLDLGLPSAAARYYGMVSHVDKRLGELREKLETLGVADNTVILFTSDNGTALNPGAMLKEAGDMKLADVKALQAGWSEWNYNAGLAGYKASVTDGGHRVPLYLHWPAGGFDDAREVKALAAHFDVMPTLIDLLGLDAPEGLKFDGVSLRPALDGDTMPDRVLVVTNQRVPMANAKRPAQVMTEQWRYLPETGALFAIEQDRGQKRDVAASHASVARQMQAAYDAWWGDMASTLGSRQRPIVGEKEQVVRLTAHDYAFNGENPPEVAWYPGFGDDSWGNYDSAWIGREQEFTPGVLEVQAERAGRFGVTLYYHDTPAARAVPFAEAHLVVNGAHQTAAVARGQDHARFEVDLPEGEIDLLAWFGAASDDAPATDETVPAFFVYVERIGD